MTLNLIMQDHFKHVDVELFNKILFYIGEPVSKCNIE